MDYQQTIEFLYNKLPAYHRIGKPAYKNNLDNTMALDNYLGHPHKKFRSIHVAGTNGKGSVSHITASILSESGFRTGLYTSPHLKDFRERIRINGEMIPEEDVTLFVNEHIEFISELNPSFFEMTVAMAFDYFAKYHVDIAVVETGLGGRLDSTNIINPVLSVITNIGHDHMDLLGGTLEKVAAEKAGIIKYNIPVVVGETQTDLDEIFAMDALKKASEISFADREFLCKMGEFLLPGEGREFCITEFSSGKRFSGTIPLGGDYQAKNLQTVFQIFRCLGPALDIDENQMLDGIRKVVENTGLMGRWQILRRSPLTICDTGHNREGLEYVIKQIAGIPASAVHIIIGFVKDKNMDLILPLMPVNARYYFTKASVPRSLDERELQSRAKEFNLSGESYSTVSEAVMAANLNAGPDDLIFIGGSNFIVAEVV